MNELTKTALFWNDLGIATIPVYYKSKQPKIRWIDYTRELPSRNLLGRWYAAKYSNIAVIAGWNDLCVIDFDDMEAFDQWRTWAENDKGTALHVLQTARISYSARGVHIYTFCPDAMNLKLPGIDILADRKYALLPPSVHPSGKEYTLFRNSMPAYAGSIRELFPADVIDKAIEQAQATPSHTEPSPLSVYQSTARYDGSESFDPWAIAGNDRSLSGESLISKIKSRYRIEHFFPDADHSGGNGRWMIARCPFHNDRNPSMSIDIENQTCSCLSSHGCTPLPLDVIGLYAKLHNLSNDQAIACLKENL